MIALLLNGHQTQEVMFKNCTVCQPGSINLSKDLGVFLYSYCYLSSSAEDGKEVYQQLERTYTAIFLLVKPFV